MARRERFAPRAGAIVAASLVAGGVAALAGPLLRSGFARLRRSGPEEAVDGTAALGRGRPETPPSAAALEQGFETRDARPRAIVAVVGTAVLVIALAIAGLFAFVGALHRRGEGAPPPTAQQRAVLLPPGPPLQSDPLADIDAFRTAEVNKRQGYAWRDRAAGRARIPLARALTLVVGRPLDPVR